MRRSLAYYHGSFSPFIMLFVFVLLSIPTKATLSKKRDQTLMPQKPNTGIKCTAACSSCENVCGQQYLSPPPPPPPSPPPPPKAPNCNPQLPLVPLPPPPPRFVYITAPPGNLYPLDSNGLDFYSGSAPNNVVHGLPLILVLLLEVLLFWAL